MSGLDRDNPAESEYKGRMASFVVLTGASGSGKTTLGRALETRHPGLCDVFYFDSIGVPSAEEMRKWGDGHEPGGAWQRAMTLEWFERLAPLVRSGRPVLFEGQMRPDFVREAMEVSGLRAQVVLVECDDATRRERLVMDRQQAELANEDMLQWARFLRKEADLLKHEVLDTSGRTIEECVERVKGMFEDRQ
jgi:predicted kinase